MVHIKKKNLKKTVSILDISFLVFVLGIKNSLLQFFIDLTTFNWVQTLVQCCVESSWEPDRGEGTTQKRFPVVTTSEKVWKTFKAGADAIRMGSQWLAGETPDGTLRHCEGAWPWPWSFWQKPESHQTIYLLLWFPSAFFRPGLHILR